MNLTSAGKFFLFLQIAPLMYVVVAVLQFAHGMNAVPALLLGAGIEAFIIAFTASLIIVDRRTKN